jgi:hypothetical protein
MDRQEGTGMSSRRTAVAVSAAVILATGAFLAYAQAAKEPAKSSYANAQYGFSMEPPVFPEVPEDMNIVVALFSAFPKNGFSSNLNVVVQRLKTTADGYAKLTKTEFEALGITVVSEKRLKVSGRDALLLHYKGKMGGRDLQFLALAVIDADRVFLATCTALDADFNTVEPAFRACLESFRLAEAPAKR